jgi:hypothetical protein
MVGPYDDADEELKDFWIWMMTTLMPLVSKDWRSRMKGKQENSFQQDDLLKYLTASDFAYIPVVIEIFGEREMVGNNCV